MKIIAGYLSFLLLIACNSKPDLEKEKQTILSMLQTERKAHFDRNADLFISEFADSMISVNKGVVSAPTKEQQKERIGKYFGSVQFIKWDDTADPVIRFSDDGSLASNELVPLEIQLVTGPFDRRLLRARSGLLCSEINPFDIEPGIEATLLALSLAHAHEDPL